MGEVRPKEKADVLSEQTTGTPLGDPGREIGGFDIEEDEELTLGDLLGFLDEVNIPESLRKRTERWKARIDAHRSRIIKGLRDVQRGIKRRGKATARRLITGDSNKKVRDFVKEPVVVRTIDCISFTLGVALLLAAEFLALKAPQHFWIFYIATTWAMISTRVWLWWEGTFKYFLCDFCYLANGFVSLVLLFAPSNPNLLQMCYVWAHGPVAFAMIAWRNSLVFHSLEKVTSLYVHALPALVMMRMRWPPTGPSAMCTDEDCQLSPMNQWVLPLIGYTVWQGVQLLLTEVIGAHEIKSRGLQTPCRWITEHPHMLAHSLTLKGARYLGIMGADERFDHASKKTKLLFVASQALYTYFTILPCTILFQSFPANAAYMGTLCIYCLWNGARYYIHVFAERYVRQFKEAHNNSANENNNEKKES